MLFSWGGGGKPNDECRLPHDSYGRDRAPFWPFFRRRILGQYPVAPCSPGPICFSADVQIAWRCPASVSGAKSGTKPATPRKLSQSKFWISRFRTVGDPQTLENKADTLSRLIPELCYPQYNWYCFLFGRAPSMEQPELVMKFLTVLGAPLNSKTLRP